MRFSSTVFMRGRSTCQAAFTRTEVLVALGIFIVLVAVGAVPLTAHLHQAKIGHAVDAAHTLNTLLAQFATDNDGVYPVGQGTNAAGKSEGIARNLLENNYTPDAAIFALGNAPSYAGKSSTFDDIAPASVSWDFTAGATPLTGLTSAAPETLPILYSTGESVTYPTTPNAGLNLSLSGSGPFTKEGMVVAYKGGNAVFIKSVQIGTATTCPGFISTAFKDTATYTQIKP